MLSAVLNAQTGTDRQETG